MLVVAMTAGIVGGLPALASPEDQTAAVSYFLEWWKAERITPEEPMYLRLPVGVDTRDWDLMYEGWRVSEGNPTPDPERKEPYEKDYDFSWDVFTWSKPNLHYLEIGTSEGRATFWMLENILTHPTCRATGIDPFFGKGQEQRFYENVEKFGHPEKVRIIKGLSQDVLPQLPPASFDIIYVDGSHLAGDVLFDAVDTWRLLKDGGVVIHDDYMWHYTDSRPTEMRPLVAIDAFITSMRNTVEVLHRGRQVILRKLKQELPPFCGNSNPCARVGNHFYAWKSWKLFEIGTRKPVELSTTEHVVLKKILRSRRFGAEADRLVPEDVAPIFAQYPKEFEHLSTLLNLKGRPSPEKSAAEPSERTSLVVAGVLYDVPVEGKAVQVDNGEIHCETEQIQFDVVDGRVVVNGTDHGTVPAGSRVKIELDGTVLVDGDRREPAADR
jgi:predicted O-methyltransferase YrrM